MELRARLVAESPVKEAGVGSALAAKLQPLGVRIMAELVALPPAIARDVGTVVPERVVRELNGIDFKPEPEASTATAVTRQFGAPVRELAELRKARRPRYGKDSTSALFGDPPDRVRARLALSPRPIFGEPADPAIASQQRSSNHRRSCNTDDRGDVSARGRLYEMRDAARRVGAGRGGAGRFHRRCGSARTGCWPLWMASTIVLDVAPSNVPHEASVCAGSTANGATRAHHGRPTSSKFPSRYEAGASPTSKSPGLNAVRH